MGPAREAAFYEALPDGRVLCTLCPRDCRIADGRRGACGVRVHRAGRLYTLAYDRIVSAQVDPIEKKPLHHYLPGSRTYSIATVGCNLRCAGCQNWGISQWPVPGGPRRRAEESVDDRLPGEPVTPGDIVAAARRAHCASIAYTYTEPTVFYELAYDTAVLARAAGLGNVFVTNGYIREAPLRRIAAVLDAANVDLKFFRDESYRRFCRGSLAPVLDAIRLYRALGVRVEVTTLVIPGVNDSDGELGDIARFLRSVGPEVPWHVTRFHPDYRMTDRPPTPVATLRRAKRIGLGEGLRHVHIGNVPGEED